MQKLIDIDKKLIDKKYLKAVLSLDLVQYET